MAVNIVILYLLIGLTVFAATYDIAHIEDQLAVLTAKQEVLLQSCKE